MTRDDDDDRNEKGDEAMKASSLYAIHMYRCTHEGSYKLNF